MPRTTAQLEELREEKLSYILEKSMELFAEKGYDGTSTAMIASASGISKGLLYHYIGSKRQLIQDIVRIGFEKVSTFFDRNRDGLLTGDEFAYFVRNSFEVIKENLHYYQLLLKLSVIPKIRIIMEEEFSYLRVREGMKQKLEHYFQTHFEEPEKEFAAYYAMHEGLGALILLRIDHFDDAFINQVIERIIEMFKR